MPFRVTDTDGGFTARDMRNFDAQHSLTPFFTSIASPEGNGVAEERLWLMKRCYARASASLTAAADLKLITERIVY